MEDNHGLAQRSNLSGTDGPNERTGLLSQCSTDTQCHPSQNVAREPVISDPAASPSLKSVTSSLPSYGSDRSILTAHAADQSSKANHQLSSRRVFLCACGIGSLMLLQATNISILTTTQSAIAEELDAFEKTSWFTSAYLIAMSSLTPLSGKLASVFAPRICIFVASVVLSIGGILCSLAQDFPGFIAGRVITGMGSGGVFTISIIITLELAGSKHRGIGLGLLNSGYTTGVAVGAVIAGALLPHIGWRPLFWMQAPIAIAGSATLLLAIPKDFGGHLSKATSENEEHTTTGPTIRQRLAQIDYSGALTLTASIVFLLYSLSSPKSIPLLPLILSAVILVIFILNEIYLATDPIIPITLLRSRGLLLTCLATIAFMMARWSVLFYAPTLAIAVRSWAPAAAGSILIPTNVGFAAGGLVVGWLHIRRPGSFYVPTLMAYVVFPITLAALALLTMENSSAALFVVAIFFNGFAAGAAVNYSLAHLLHLIPKETHYVATALVATFRSFAGSFGSAIGGGVFTRTLSNSLRTHFADRSMLEGREGLIRRLLGQPAAVRTLEGAEREVAVQGYEDALRALWLAGAAISVLVVLMQAGTGWRGDAETKESKDEEREALIPESGSQDHV